MEDREKGMVLFYETENKGYKRFSYPGWVKHERLKHTAMRAMAYSGTRSSRSFTVGYTSFGGITTSECHGVMQQNKLSLHESCVCIRLGSWQ